MSRDAEEQRPVPASASSAQQLRDARPFAGKPGEDVDEWLIHYKRVSAYNKWNSTSQLSNVVFFLTDTALVWFDNNEETFTTWERFVSQIKERFGDSVTKKKRAELTLSQRAQVPGETCMTYIEEVLKLCRMVDSGMSEEDKVGHILKGIAEDVYSFLIAKDNLASVADVIRHCRTFEQLKTRRVTPKFGRLANVTTVASIDNDQSLDLASTIRQIVREELSLHSQVTHRDTYHPCSSPAVETTVSSFSEYPAEYRLPPRQPPLVYESGAPSDARSRWAEPRYYRQGPVTYDAGTRPEQRRPYYQDPNYDRYNRSQRTPEASYPRENELAYRPQRASIGFEEYTVNRDPPVCYSCGSTGHIARYCRQHRQPRRTPPMFSPPGTRTSHDPWTSSLPTDRFSREIRRSDSPASDRSLTPPINRPRRSPSPRRRASSPPPGN